MNKPIKVISKHFIFRDGTKLEKEIEQKKARKAYKMLQQIKPSK